jgi:Secretion system C-terminal sorting domain/Beta-propeller repeat
MKKIVLLLALFIGFITNAQNTFEWAKSIGGQNYDDANSIALDGQGNVYVTGRFQKFVGTEVDFDPGAGVYNIAAIGQYDAFVVKLNANGEFLWAKNFGGGGVAVAGNGITVDSNGNVYTTGLFPYTIDFDPSSTSEFFLNAINQFGFAATDVFISKLDSNGNFVWAKNIGAQFSETGVAITHDSNDNIYVSGKFTGTVDFDPNGGTAELTGISSSSGFILKLNSSGNFIWAKSISGAGKEVVTAITVDALGNVIATGNFGSATDLDPGVGIFKITGNGAFILKLDSSGNFIFAKGFVSNSNLDCSAIKVDASGNIFTTGTFQQTADFDPSASTFELTGIYGNSDVFITKLNNLGDFVWAKKIHSSAADSSKTIALDNLGNAYIAIYIETANFKIDNSASIDVYATTRGSDNMIILKFDTTGVLLAKNALGGTSVVAMAVDNNYNVHTCGNYVNSTDFNPDTPILSLLSNGYTDTFISKMKLRNETLGISSNKLNKKINLFPNPTTNNLNLTFEENLVKASLKITSILGQTVLEKQNISGNNVSLDVSGLSMGTYIIQVKNANSINTSKFIKQ